MFAIFLHTIMSYFLHSSPQTVSFFFFLHILNVFLFSSQSSLFFPLYLFVIVCLTAFYRFRTSLHSSSCIHHFFFFFFFVINNLVMRVIILYEIRRKKFPTSTALSIMKTCTPFKPPAKGRPVKRHRNAMLKVLNPSSIHFEFRSFITSVAEDSLLCGMETLHCLELRYSSVHWRSF